MYLKEESPPLREISSKELVEVIFRKAQLSPIQSALGLLRSCERKGGPHTCFTGSLLKLRGYPQCQKFYKDFTEFYKECLKVLLTKSLYLIRSVFYKTQI